MQMQHTEMGEGKLSHITGAFGMLYGVQWFPEIIVPCLKPTNMAKGIFADVLKVIDLMRKKKRKGEGERDGLSN